MNKTENAAHSSERAQALRSELFGQDLTVDEVAHILDLDRSTILRYLRDNVLFGFQIGREWHVTLEALCGYVDELKRTPKPGTDARTDPERLWQALIEIDSYLAHAPWLWRIVSVCKVGDVLCDVLGPEVIGAINAEAAAHLAEGALLDPPSKYIAVEGLGVPA